LVDLTGQAPSQATLIDLASVFGMGSVARGIAARRDAPLAALSGGSFANASQCASRQILQVLPVRLFDGRLIKLRDGVKRGRAA